MAALIPKTPSYTFGYWRPWNENSNVFDSYLDYTKDVSLARYGADIVGQYIQSASKDQIQAINNLGNVFGQGLEDISEQLSEINITLSFINRNLDLLIEQQNLTNLLLHNVAELLRVPDSEKERQHCIELGIKFFVNAKKDEDLYEDALEELTKAEALMKQDYFVLHRIGCIYLYVNKFINPEKAFEYFIKAAKYASVESDKDAVKLANILTKNLNSLTTESSKSVEKIGLLAADSYEKSAFSAYVLGRFADAVTYQTKALKFNNSNTYRFLLAKYQARNGDLKDSIQNLNKCIDQDPVFIKAIIKEIDLLNEPKVLELIGKKNDSIDKKITELIESWTSVKSEKSAELCKDLNKILQKSYPEKIVEYNKFKNKGVEIETSNKKLIMEIDKLITEITNTTFLTLDQKKISTIKDELIRAKELSPEKMELLFDEVKYKLEKDKLKIGSKYAGGIVFYLDKTGKHGLVCAAKDLGKAIWGEGRGIFREDFSAIGANANKLGFDAGKSNTKKIVALASSGFFGGKINTAARMCLEANINGYKDWYLPTEIEIVKIFNNVFTSKLFKHYKYWTSTEDKEFGLPQYYWRGPDRCLGGDSSQNYGVIPIRQF